jgi:hypothetical protein
MVAEVKPWRLEAVTPAGWVEVEAVAHGVDIQFGASLVAVRWGAELSIKVTHGEEVFTLSLMRGRRNRGSFHLGLTSRILDVNVGPLQLLRRPNHAAYPEWSGPTSDKAAVWARAQVLVDQLWCQGLNGWDVSRVTRWPPEMAASLMLSDKAPDLATRAFSCNLTADQVLAGLAQCLAEVTVRGVA